MIYQKVVFKNASQNFNMKASKDMLSSKSISTLKYSVSIKTAATLRTLQMKSSHQNVNWMALLWMSLLNS